MMELCSKEEIFMSEHPIQGLMKTAMENIKGMVDVNTIVGSPVETPDGSVIMPISKVGFGFAAGGSEFTTDAEAIANGKDTVGHNAAVNMPFGGGSGGGVSITPIAFLVVGKQGVNIVSLDNQTHIFERLIDSAPQLVEKIQSMMQSSSSGASGTQASSSTPPSGVSSEPAMITKNQSPTLM
jgi:sporulation protein YtfJ